MRGVIAWVTCDRAPEGVSCGPEGMVASVSAGHQRFPVGPLGRRGEIWCGRAAATTIRCIAVCPILADPNGTQVLRTIVHFKNCSKVLCACRE